MDMLKNVKLKYNVKLIARGIIRIIYKMIVAFDQ